VLPACSATALVVAAEFLSHLLDVERKLIRQLANRLGTAHPDNASAATERAGAQLRCGRVGAVGRNSEDPAGSANMRRSAS